MSRRGDDRVFSEAEVRRAGMLSVAAAFVLPAVALAAGVFVKWLLGDALGPVVASVAGAAAGIALLVTAGDYLSLGWYNKRMRRRLAAKLRRLGELPGDLADPNVYFVGLAHPAKVGLLRWETDDEIGFVQLGFDSLTYRGDRLSFEVPFEDLAAVELVPIGFGLPRRFKRIRLVFRGGEPFDELLLCSREGDRLSSGNDVTHILYEAIHKRWLRRGGVRLAAESELADDLELGLRSP